MVLASDKERRIAMPMWRCLNNVFKDCSDQERWNNEATEQRQVNPDPNIKIVLRCELNPDTCGKTTVYVPPNVDLSKEVTWTHNPNIENETANSKKKRRKNTKDKIQYKQGSIFDI